MVIADEIWKERTRLAARLYHEAVICADAMNDPEAPDYIALARRAIHIANVFAGVAVETDGETFEKAMQRERSTGANRHREEGS